MVLKMIQQSIYFTRYGLGLLGIVIGMGMVFQSVLPIHPSFLFRLEGDTVPLIFTHRALLALVGACIYITATQCLPLGERK